MIAESVKHEIRVPTHSFAVVNYYVSSIELAPWAIINNSGQFSRLSCASNMAGFDLLCVKRIVLL